MLLEELTLNNFCLYKGRQTFELAPSRKNGSARPIVLCGGINGGGKTTLLDAIQLALYGARARCSKRANLPYDDFLQGCIHRGAPAGEGASVSLTFRYAAEGRDSIYTIERAWNTGDGKLRETLRISRDGALDRWLSDNWHQRVDDLVPLGISQLFFFDAEQIRFLAEDETGNEALGTAIKSLLGLDLAERLIADAGVLEARLARRLTADDDRDELADLDRRISAADDEVREAVTERAMLENDFQRAATEAQRAEERFARIGGEHWREHEERKARVKLLQGQQEKIEAELVELAAGEWPLAMVADLRASVAEQDRRERQATESLVVARLLEERDAHLLAVMEEQRVPVKTLTLVRELMEADRRQRQTAVDAPRRLALSEQAHGLLAELERHALPKRQEEVGRLLTRLRQVRHEREETDRSLAATPAEETVKEASADLSRATKQHALLEDAARRLDARIEAGKRALAELTDRRDKLVLKRVRGEIREEETMRMARLAARTKTTMREFLNRATAAKIDRLASLVTESFRFLLRKQTLVEQILIDPATFAIELRGADGLPLAKQRLSVVREGDRHIFPGRLTRWRFRQCKVRALFAGKMSQSPCSGGWHGPAHVLCQPLSTRPWLGSTRGTASI